MAELDADDWHESISHEDDELEIHLSPPPSRGQGQLDSDDEMSLDGVLPDLEAVRKQAKEQQATGSDIVSRKGGGWHYSIGRLLQAVLYVHYLRCAADFARSVVFAVAFALGPKAWWGCGSRAFKKVMFFLEVEFIGPQRGIMGP